VISLLIGFGKKYMLRNKIWRCTLKGPLHIVHFLDFNWQEDQRRPHLVALSKYCFILCIEPPLTLDVAIRKPGIFLKDISKIFSPRQINNNLFVYKPLMFLSPIASLMIPALERINLFSIKPFLFSVMRKLSIKNKILAIRHPAWRFVIGCIGEEFFCYEVSDEWSELPSSFSAVKHRIREVEKDVIKKADIVFCSAKRLTESKKIFNPNTFFIGNAADITLFEHSSSFDSPLPDELAKIPRPRIGLIGNINDQVDMKLILYLARQHSDWSVILIGKINGSRKFINSATFLESRRLKNIHHMGWRNYETLPAYQKGLDVCLLPYLVNEYTRNVYPNKLHQYLAGGKPVVSTDLPEMRPFEGVIFIAKTYHEFLSYIEKALVQNEAAFIHKRIEVARENSVENNANTRFDLLQEYFLKRRRLIGIA
jgi:glycosyltransferase involved in cell wall biosynthesis